MSVSFPNPSQGTSPSDSARWRRLYEVILAATPDFVYVFDSSHRVAYANDILLKMWGKTWDEAIGKSFLEIGYEPWHAAMHEREIDQVIATKQPLRGEVPFNGTFGRRIYDYIFVPVFGPDGSVEAVAGTTRDVTDRKEIEDALRQSEAHFSSLFEQTSAGIVETDLEGNILSVNDRFCRLLGISRELLIGSNLVDHAHPDDLPSKFSVIPELVETQKSFQLDVRYMRPGEVPLWTNTSLSLIQGEKNSLLAVVLDISQRKQAEEALQRADKRKDEFLAMLAHELRNPLAPISAAATLMEMGSMDEAKIRKSCQIINRQVKHMVGLVDDLLDVSRVTRGLVTIDRTVQDMKAVIAQSIEQVRPLVEAKRHTLVLELAPEPANVLGDEKRLIQVVTNLLNNAAKYTQESGQIRIEMEVKGLEVVLSVIDNGMGIAPELQPHVFELFAQGQRSADRTLGGLGVGLALAQSLVELHHGSIRCHSAGHGQGSRFVVCLPLLTHPEKNGAKSDIDSLPSQGNSRMKVLVVDDNKDAADMLANLLQETGYIVSVEYDSKGALERAKVESPHICLLDIGLPEMDGNELARLLRRQPETAHAVMIAITGYGQESDRRLALASGFNHHMVKPVDMVKLGTLLNEIVHRVI